MFPTDIKPKHSNFLGTNFSFFTTTEIGRLLLTDMSRQIINSGKNMQEIPAWIQLEELSNSEIDNEVDGYLAYSLCSLLRAVRHESAHISAGLIFGRKELVNLKSVNFRRNVPLERMMKELFEKDNFTVISSGSVEVDFYQSSKKWNPEDTVFIALCIVYCPEIYEVPYKYIFDSVEYKEGGLSEIDIRVIEKLKAYCKKENVDYDKVFVKSVNALQNNKERINNYIDPIARYMLPKLSLGRTHFSISEIKRGIRS